MSHIWRGFLATPTPAADLARQIAADEAFELFGTVLLDGRIDKQLEREVRRQVERAARFAGQVSLQINSDGGLVHSADGIARHLRQLTASNIPVSATVGRECFSAAVRPLLAAAPSRSAIPCSQFMVHSLSGTFDAFDEAHHGALIAGLRLTPWQAWAAQTDDGLWMTAREAKRAGLVDTIAVPEW